MSSNSKQVDERIVSMQFDNRQFEKNVQTSLNTIEKLRSALNLTGAAKGLEGVQSAANGLNLNPLTGAAEKVGLKFNAMYTIADQALRRIVDSAMAAGERIVKSLTIDPIKMGFSEYETQINAIQTILANTESKGTTLDDVNGALDELNAYADKTIYNFTEMTRNIGTFTAAGVDLDTSVSAIKGIANLAAVSGSTSQQASTAMYQLSQALSSGTVKLMDWNSVVNAGMGGQVFQDALKETARVHGIAIDDLIAKEGSFRETLQHGWLSSEILTETLSKFTGDLTEEQLKSMGYTDEQTEKILKMGQTANDAATKVKTFTQLMDTLKEAAQSGWTQTWEILIGDFEEARTLFTKVSDTIGGILGESAEARNELLENWKVLGGRDDVIQSIANAFEAVMQVVNLVKEAMAEVFPPLTAEKLVAFTTGLKNFTEKLKLSETASNNLKRTFKGVFAVVDIVRQVFVALFKAVGSLFGPVTELGGGLLGITASIGDWLVALNETIKSGDLFNSVFKTVASILKVVIKAVSTVIKFVGQKIVCPGFEFLAGILQGVSDRMTSVSDTANGMGDIISEAFKTIGSTLESLGILKLLDTLWSGIKIIASGIAKTFGAFVEHLATAVKEGNFSGVLDFIRTLITGGVGVALIKFFRDLASPARSFADLIDGFGGMLEGVGGVLEGWQSKLKAEALKQIAIAVAILAASLFVLALIDEDDLYRATAGITVLFAELSAAMYLMGKIFKDVNHKQFASAAGAIVSVATAILILSVAMKIMSTMSWEEMGVGLISTVVGLGSLVAAVKFLPERNVKKAAAAIRKLSVALVIMALALKIMGSMSWKEMGVGLISLVVGLGAMVAAMKLLPKNIGTKALGLIALATSLVILGAALKIMGSMSWQQMSIGLVSMAGGLTAIVLAMNLLPKGTSMKTLSLIGLAAAVVVLASAMKIMSSMSWEQMGIGLINLVAGLAALAGVLWIIPSDALLKVGPLIGLAAACVILGAALQIMGKMSWKEMGIGLINLVTGLAAMAGVLWIIPSDALLKVGPMLVLAAAIVVLAGALKIMGSMNWEQMGVALISLVGSLAALALGLHAMSGTIPGSIALTVAAGALLLLAPVLLLLGTMSWEAIAKGLVAIAGSLAILGIAGFALAHVTPVLIGLGVAMALMGVGVLAAGVGLAAFGVGLSALAGGLVAITASLDIIILSIVKIVEAIVVAIIKGIANGIIEFCNAIAAGTGAITNAIKEVIFAICDLIIECIPKLVETVFATFDGVIEAFVSYIPKMLSKYIGYLGSLITSILDSLAIHVPEILKSAINFLMSLFNGLVDGFSQIDPSALVKGIACLGLLIAMLALLSTVSALTPSAMMGILGLGAIVLELGAVLAAIGAISKIPGLQWLISQGGNFLRVVGEAIGNFMGGIIGGIAGGLASKLPKIGTELSEFMTNATPFIEGASKISASTMDGVKSLIGIITSLTKANILESLTSWLTGGSSLTKFGKELASFAPNFRTYADTMAGIDPSVVEASAGAAKTLAEMTQHIPNSGGVVSWFTGDNSISKFGEELITLGIGLKGFAVNVAGINPEEVTAAAEAAKSLALMTQHIPNSGGVGSWFAGDNSISKFGVELITLGEGLKGFSDNVTGVNPETITAAANAAKALAEMTAYIPNSGGVVSWFAGDNSIAAFGNELVTLGISLKVFSTNVAGINPEQLSAAAESAKVLAEMTQHIPNSGGVFAWFAGDNSISRFASELVTLGVGLKGFSNSVGGINAEHLTAAANAAKALAQMTQYIPNSGGVASWFAGDNSITNFSGELPKLGAGLKGFSDSVAGINPENLTAAAEAAKTIAEMTSVTIGSVNKIPALATGLSELGDGMKHCFSQFAGIGGESITAAKNAVQSIESVVSIDDGKIKSMADAINDITDSIKNLSSIPKNAAQEFSNALTNMGETSADALLKAFKDLTPDMETAGKDNMDSFIKGLNDKQTTVEDTCTTLAKACTDTIGESKETFYNAGANLVTGFTNGIDANAYKAAAKARAMAKAAADAAEDELDINSPSRVFYGIGGFAGQGFVNALSDYGTTSYKAGSEMGDSAKSGLSDAISKIQGIINGDIDLNPTIRPVLDLSDVRAGASGIGRLFDSETSIGVLSNIGAINSSMKRNNQNGVTDQIVSEISKLRKDLSNIEHATYHINGITYDDGSNISDAVKTLIRATNINRRS